MLKGRNSLAVKSGFAQQIPQMFMPIPEVSSLLASATRSDQSPTSFGLTHKVENGCKRSADVLGETFYPSLYFKRPHVEFPLISPVSYQPIFDFPTPAEREYPHEANRQIISSHANLICFIWIREIATAVASSVIPLNASFVNYTDGNGQVSK
jgi:hypothetical protein